MNNLDIRLSALSLPARILLTCFLALIGFGYLSALGNLYHQHQFADGRAGLTLDDLRVTFHGMALAPAAESGGAAAARDMSSVQESRMLEMIEPGGSMRKHLLEGGEPAVRSLTVWLERGAPRDLFEQGGAPQPDDPAPRSIIEDRCLSCHNAATGEKSDAPYGPDLFTVEYELVARFAQPGTATGERGPRMSAVADVPDGGGLSPPKVSGPMPLPHLLLVTHIHMLSIPLFTLIVGGLFLLVDRPGGRVRGVLAVVPILILVFDFSSWWLARALEPFIYVIAAAGALYGAAFGVQILAVFAALWFRGDRSGGHGGRATAGKP